MAITIAFSDIQHARIKRTAVTLCTFIVLVILFLTISAARAQAAGEAVFRCPTSVVLSGNALLFIEHTAGETIDFGLQCHDVQLLLALDVDEGQVFCGLASPRWGPGRSGSLVLSGNVNPMPMVGYRINRGASSYVRLLGMMERNGDRRLFGHRLEYSPRSTIAIGISETAVIAENASLLLYWPFPGLPIYAIQHVLAQRDSSLNRLVNVNVGVDFRAKFAFPASVMTDNVEVYGELFVDDAQGKVANRSSIPDWFGGLAGVDITQIPGLPGLEVNLEYVGITNYVYSHSNPQVDYTFEGAIIGHPLGPDADSLILTVRVRASDSTELTLAGSTERHGEGRIGHPWKREYGRNDLFLSGVVEKVSKLEVGLEHSLTERLSLKAGAGYCARRNYGHVQGVSWEGWSASIGIEARL